jgi:tRNA nucleotidyltransferase/poly(A) polymerase
MKKTHSLIKTKNSFETNIHLLNEILISDNVYKHLDILEKSGYLYNIIPDFNKITRMNSNSFKSVWPHTMKVVSQSKPTIIQRWAALFHDFGKASTFNIKNNKVTFHGHEIESSKWFQRFSCRWKESETSLFTKNQYNQIKFVIRNLGYVEGYKSNWTDSAVRRFSKDMGNNVNDLLDLSRADITTKHDHKRQKILGKIDELEKRIQEIKIKDSYTSPFPKGFGNFIMEITGLEPGREVAKIKKEIENKIELGYLLPNQEKTYYKNCIKNLTIF